FALGQDGDFNEKALVRRHNSELADKLGNLVSRVTALAEQYGIEKCKNRLLKELNIKEIVKCFENFKIDKVLNIIFEFIDKCNLYVQQNELWKTKDKKKIYELCDSIKAIAILLWPFIPSAAEKIAEHFNFEIKNLKQINKRLKTEKIKKIEILFKKLEENTLDKIKKEKIQEGKMENISFEEWKRIDLRIGRITSVKKHPNADKLFILEVDLGALGKRNIVAGLQGHYSEKDLNGKYCVVLVNLEPKEIRGVKSEGMLLAAVNESCVILLVPEKEINPGSKVE
ncbi:MAG: class I tRNA ligase family protein, partial [Candidatus Pacearchaeota archaeon]|nr:class I tRNA ligase family protein [Candidatus Pacearchaeota archaeon]